MENWIKFLFLFVVQNQLMLGNIQDPNTINHICADNISLDLNLYYTFASSFIPHFSTFSRKIHTRVSHARFVYNNNNDAWLLIWRGFNVQVDFLPEKFTFLSSFLQLLYYYTLLLILCVLAKYTNCYYSVR